MFDAVKGSEALIVYKVAWTTIESDRWEAFKSKGLGIGFAHVDGYDVEWKVFRLDLLGELFEVLDHGVTVGTLRMVGNNDVWVGILDH